MAVLATPFLRISSRSQSNEWSRYPPNVPGRPAYGRQPVADGGAQHDAHVAFLEWAGQYDTGGLEMRSRALHEAWLTGLSCAVVRLEGDRSPEEQLAVIEARS